MTPDQAQRVFRWFRDFSGARPLLTIREDTPVRMQRAADEAVAMRLTRP